MFVPGRIFISRAEIDKKVRKMAHAISQDYIGNKLFLVGILKGAFVFLADLIRYLHIPVEIDFMAVSSYGSSTESSGLIRINKDLERECELKNVIIVEDIVDTGLTSHFIYKKIAHLKPESIKIASLLDKPDRRQVKVPIDYNGFTVPDIFLVGYGLDYNEKYRNLPDIHVLDNYSGV